MRFSVKWTDDAGGNTTNDLAMYLYGPDGKLVAAADGSQNLEGINVTVARAGHLQRAGVRVPEPADRDRRTPARRRPTRSSRARSPSRGRKAPTYHQFSAPAGVADNAGEPSIGSNWKTGNTLFTSNTDEYVVNFDDKARTSTWTNVNDDPTDPSNKISLDPIGWTDHTHRPHDRQPALPRLLGDGLLRRRLRDAGPPLRRAAARASTGSTTRPSAAAPTRRACRAATRTPSTTAARAARCCSARRTARAATTAASPSDPRSRCGTPSAPASTVTCRSAPTARSTCPTPMCGNRQGVAVSRDGGQTWKVRTIPGSIAGQSDPYVGVGLDNTLYVAYADGTGEARVAISRDHGATWMRNLNVGSLAGIRNTEFAMVVAGDGDRASVAFLGTRTPGSTQAAVLRQVGRRQDLHRRRVAPLRRHDLRPRRHLEDGRRHARRPGAARLHLELRRQQPLPQPARLQRHHDRQDRPRHGRLRRRVRGSRRSTRPATASTAPRCRTTVWSSTARSCGS